MDKKISVDELLNQRKDFCDDDGVMYKAAVSPRSWNNQERSATFIMSAETEDRHRDIVIQSGIDRDSFDKNPVALFGHNSWGTPIGTWSDIKTVKGSKKRTEGKLTFVEEGVDDQADTVARHVAAGSLRACSIGFRVRDAERILDEEGKWTYGYQFNSIELMECSVVTIPAVREALIKGKTSDGEIITPEVIESFLEQLKSNPALARMVDKDVYEQVYREITGNKSVVVLPDGWDELRKTVKDLGSKVDALTSKDPAVGDPQTDEIEQSIKDGVEQLVSDVTPKIDELPDDDCERKGVLKSMVEGIRNFISPPPEPLDEEKRNAVLERMKLLETEE